MEKTQQKNKYHDELIATANAIVVKGKGILAADESTGTIGKRFDSIKVENNDENRRAYRELLFTSEGIENYISGVILFKDTLSHKTEGGVPLVKVLQDKGIIPGIKVDAGTVDIPGLVNETSTQGLDNLGKTCAEYYKQGCRFAKWRAVLRIDQDKPSRTAILENAHGLARYAQICQENGLVPIVEPEVLVDGTHTIEECALKSEIVFHYVFRALHDFGVILEGILLKPNMITPGSESTQKVSSQEIAYMTVRTLLRTVPGSVPGITFLSGGQSEEQASENLNDMNVKDFKLQRPWHLSFSYGRALQASCLAAWQGKKENWKAAQEAFLLRAKANSEATKGELVVSGKEGKSLHVKDYVY
jgi:fructose-bisphosphate aldolase class I